MWVPYLRILNKTINSELNLTCNWLKSRCSNPWFDLNSNIGYALEFLGWKKEKNGVWSLERVKVRWNLVIDSGCMLNINENFMDWSKWMHAKMLLLKSVRKRKWILFLTCKNESVWEKSLVFGINTTTITYLMLNSHLVLCLTSKTTRLLHIPLLSNK
jgi:hypothetical protein